jgi:hypothetical protein
MLLADPCAAFSTYGPSLLREAASVVSPSRSLK